MVLRERQNTAKKQAGYGQETGRIQSREGQNTAESGKILTRGRQNTGKIQVEYNFTA
jgi:hypothetical protein